VKKKIISAYEKLLSQFGHKIRNLKTQNSGHETVTWWPADSDYEVVVGAILTQNTNWKNVEKAIANLKKENKLTEQEILAIKLESLEHLIRPSGFYKQKAERLKLATKKWLELQDNRLTINELRTELLSVKGIGKETADSIVLYAFHKPIFVIDAYTRRFCKQFFDFEAKDYDEYRVLFESSLPKDVNLFKEYHALIVEWGKDKSRK